VLQRVYIPLPEAEARGDMFRVQLEGEHHSLTPADFSLLAARTHGFSGSDIAVAAADALLEPFRLTKTSSFFRCVATPTCSTQDCCCDSCSESLTTGPEIVARHWG